jgi:hypothetical protein
MKPERCTINGCTLFLDIRHEHTPPARRVVHCSCGMLFTNVQHDHVKALLAPTTTLTPTEDHRKDPDEHL